MGGEKSGKSEKKDTEGGSSVGSKDGGYFPQSWAKVLYHGQNDTEKRTKLVTKQWIEGGVERIKSVGGELSTIEKEK